MLCLVTQFMYVHTYNKQNYEEKLNNRFLLKYGYEGIQNFPYEPSCPKGDQNAVSSSTLIL